MKSAKAPATAFRAGLPWSPQPRCHVKRRRARLVSAGTRRRRAIPLVLAVAAILCALAVVMIFLGNRRPGQLSGVAEEINDVPSGQMAVAPDSESLFVVDARTADLHVVDVATRSTTDRVGLPPGTGIGLSPDGRIAATHLDDDSLSFVDTELGEVVGTVSVRRPLDVVSPQANALAEFDTESQTVAAHDPARQSSKDRDHRRRPDRLRHEPTERPHVRRRPWGGRSRWNNPCRWRRGRSSPRSRRHNVVRRQSSRRRSRRHRHQESGCATNTPCWQHGPHLGFSSGSCG